MSNEIERIEPKINSTPPEIIVMRSSTGEHFNQTNNKAWSLWALFGLCCTNSDDLRDSVK